MSLTVVTPSFSYARKMTWHTMFQTHDLKCDICALSTAFIQHVSLQYPLIRKNKALETVWFCSVLESTSP